MEYQFGVVNGLTWDEPKLFDILSWPHRADDAWTVPIEGVKAAWNFAAARGFAVMEMTSLPAIPIMGGWSPRAGVSP